MISYKNSETIIQYNNFVGKFKKRIDGVTQANADYILFLDGDDYFSNEKVLKNIYFKAINDSLDILEFRTFHYSRCDNMHIYRQPALFDVMHFGDDKFNIMWQYHLSGKLIKKQLFLNIIKKLDAFYLKQKIEFYEESIFLFLLFKNAESFEDIKIEGTKKICFHCTFDYQERNEQNNKDLLLFLKILIQYTDNNVPEKRMAAFSFIDYLVNKGIIINDNNNKQLLNEIVDLYLTCDKIGDKYKKIIKDFLRRNSN